MNGKAKLTFRKEKIVEMPRSAQNNFASAFGRLQKQARGLLVALRGQIRATESEIARLKKEEAKLMSLAGEAARNGATVAGRGRPRKGGRINWGTVLQRMPRQFKASHVRSVRGLKDKRSSEIFAAITRWIDAGAVKRRERGVYERVK